MRADKAIGLGTTPTLRLQRALATPGSFRAWEKLLVWSHWLWFLFPHGTVAYLLLRRPEHFPRGAAQIYATFDIGLDRLLGDPDRSALVRRARRA